MLCFLIGKEALTFGFEVKQILYFRKDFMIRKIRNFFNDYSVLVLAVLANIFGQIIRYCSHELKIELK